jgi:hypothetical protein
VDELTDLFGGVEQQVEQIELDHLLEFLADGPVKETHWCVLDTAPPEMRAPGGAVLCVAGTLVPHAKAEVKAREAWRELGRWRERYAAG